ncbi:hypothetical protein U9M48_025022 [Paspalum notatum var. saurae]|uniref:Uncharacterized protein n=1 Tax=Paspalum notatum var. saurae TaxID=547442 RepID=A0AAQ3TSF1_PASNO
MSARACSSRLWSMDGRNVIGFLVSQSQCSSCEIADWTGLDWTEQKSTPSTVVNFASSETTNEAEKSLQVLKDWHRYDGRDRTASVIAADLRKQTVRDVAKFGSERHLGYSCIYLGSGISKHLPPTRGKSSETSKNEIVLQPVKHDVPGKNLQSEPTSKVDGTSPK